MHVCFFTSRGGSHSRAQVSVTCGDPAEPPERKEASVPSPGPEVRIPPLHLPPLDH